MDYSVSNPKVLSIKRGRRVAELICSILEEHIPKSSNVKYKVLDVGSSSGIISEQIYQYLKKKMGSSPAYIGIDTDINSIKLANKIKKENLSFKVANAAKLEFKNDTFDLIILSQVYMYFKNQRKFFSEIYRVLKPGGIVYFSGSNKLRLKKPFEPTKVYYSDVWELRDMLSKFEIEYQTSKVVKLKYGLYFPLIRPVWNFLELLNPNFMWVLKKPC